MKATLTVVMDLEDGSELAIADFSMSVRGKQIDRFKRMVLDNFGLQIGMLMEDAFEQLDKPAEPVLPPEEIKTVVVTELPPVEVTAEEDLNDPGTIDTGELAVPAT